MSCSSDELKELNKLQSEWISLVGLSYLEATERNLKGTTIQEKIKAYKYRIQMEKLFPSARTRKQR